MVGLGSREVEPRMKGRCFVLMETLLTGYAIIS